MAGERKLTNRRKRASKGRILRVSRAVFDALDAGRRRGRNEGKLPSWDQWMRRTFGLPERDGTEQRLVEGMLDPVTGLLLLKLPSTAWEDLEQTAYRLAEERARKLRRKAQPPVRMREVR